MYLPKNKYDYDNDEPLTNKTQLSVFLYKFLTLTE